MSVRWSELRVRLPLRRAVGQPAPAPTRAEGDAVSAWLDVLCRLMRLGRAETDAIRAELEEHLRERVRDLMLDGLEEDAATRRAIEELGEAAVLADRFRRAERSPRRRMAMNIALIGVAAGATVLGALALHQNGSKPVAGVAPPSHTLYAGSELADKAITLPADATLDKLTQELGRVSGHPVNVYWDVLAEQGLKRDTPIGVPLSNVSVETALAIANERLGGDKQIACRMTGDMLEVSTLRHFDKRETTLRAYDVGPVLTAFQPIRQPAEVAMELQDLIRGVIDPEQWRENGGDLAQMYMVGTKLFVTAPARFHPTVEWILGQLQTGRQAGATAPPADARRPPDRYTVRPGDTWRSMSRELLGDEERWMALAWANGGGGSQGLEPAHVGQELRMPDQAAMNASYQTAASSPETFRAQHAADAGWWKRLVALNPRLEVDWVAGRVLRMPDRAGDPSTAPLAEGGGVYFVSGDVARPGTYSLPARGVTLRQAIIASGGRLDGVAGVTVTRTTGDKVEVVCRMTGAELRGQAAKDPSIQPGQVVEVHATEDAADQESAPPHSAKPSREPSDASAKPEDRASLAEAARRKASTGEPLTAEEHALIEDFRSPK